MNFHNIPWTLEQHKQKLAESERRARQQALIDEARKEREISRRDASR